MSTLSAIAESPYVEAITRGLAVGYWSNPSRGTYSEGTHYSPMAWTISISHLFFLNGPYVLSTVKRHDSSWPRLVMEGFFCLFSIGLVKYEYGWKKGAIILGALFAIAGQAYSQTTANDRETMTTVEKIACPLISGGIVLITGFLPLLKQAASISRTVVVGAKAPIRTSMTRSSHLPAGELIRRDIDWQKQVRSCRLEKQVDERGANHLCARIEFDNVNVEKAQKAGQALMLEVARRIEKGEISSVTNWHAFPEFRRGVSEVTTRTGWGRRFQAFLLGRRIRDRSLEFPYQTLWFRTPRRPDGTLELLEVGWMQRDTTNKITETYLSVGPFSGKPQTMTEAQILDLLKKFGLTPTRV